MLAIIIVLAVVVVLAVAAAAWFYLQQRRTSSLRRQFGPEYDRAVQESGGAGHAKHELEERRERVEQLHIRPLDSGDRERLGADWRHAQAQFVDDPPGAIRSADRLIGDVMQRRGYPVGDFEARAADLSVDHASVVSNYRAAHAIALKSARGEATTEDLRQAMVYYRSLFDELAGLPQEVHR